MNIKITVEAEELAGAINNLADAVREFISSDAKVSVSQEKIEQVVKSEVDANQKSSTQKAEKEPSPEEEATDKPKQEEETTVTIEDVRPILAQLTKAGKRDAVKDLFYHFGADKLSGVAEKDYPKLLEEAKKLL